VAADLLDINPKIIPSDALSSEVQSASGLAGSRDKAVSDSARKCWPNGAVRFARPFGGESSVKNFGWCVNIELLMDMLTAPFYFRVLFGRPKLSSMMIETVVDTVFRGAAN
jgi:hypothetical protein